MTAFNWEQFDPEQVVVTSGVDDEVDIPLLCGAWMILDLVRWTVPTVVIDNRTPPGIDGSTPLDKAIDQVQARNRFMITGTVEQDGTPVTGEANVRTQFRRHWVFLSQHLFLPAAPLDAVYTPPDPDEDPIEFRIQFATPELNPEGGMWPSDWLGLVSVVLPDGPLIPGWAGS